MTERQASSEKVIRRQHRLGSPRQMLVNSENLSVGSGRKDEKKELWKMEHQT